MDDDKANRETQPSGNEKGSASERFSAFWHIWFPGMLFAALVLVFELTDLDLYCSDLFYDFSRGQFYWKRTWWANDLIHKGGYFAIEGLVIFALALLVLSFLKRGPRLVNAQRALTFFLLSVAIGPGTVATWKQVSNRPLPVEVQRYGGKAPYIKLFHGTHRGSKRFKGFPAAHASGGYSLMALYFILRKRGRRAALAGLALGLAVGTVFAFGQQVRGVHFASHNVWAAAICWYGSLLLFLFPFRRNVNGPLFLRRRKWNMTTEGP